VEVLPILISEQKINYVRVGGRAEILISFLLKLEVGSIEHALDGHGKILVTQV
jgi:hypothetical protein